VTPDYKATAYVTLIPPTELSPAPADSLRNPYLSLGLIALNQAASTVTKDQSFLKELADSGLSDAVTIEEGYPAPIATIEAIGGSKELAIQTLNRVVDRFVQSVERLQLDTGAKANSLITTQRLGADNVEETGGKVKRAAIGVGAAGLLLTAAVTIGVDSVLRRRQRRRSPTWDDLPPPQTRSDFRPVMPLAATPITTSRPAPSVAGGSDRAGDTSGVAHPRLGPRRSADSVGNLPALRDDPAEFPGREHSDAETETASPDTAFAQDATVILPLSITEGGRQRRNGGKAT
jgi:hypothetical protein